MRLWDLIGYLAAGLVLAAFWMRDMVPLRIAALGSNLAFIAYGLALGLVPVWLLHALLLPMNGYRLLDASRSRPNRAGRGISWSSAWSRQTAPVRVGFRRERPPCRGVRAQRV